MAFYGFVFAAALHHTYLRGGRDRMDHPSEMLQISYQTKAIQCINNMLDATKNTPPSDEILVSILILAAHGQRRGGEPWLEPVHPPSPLARAQNLQFYGSHAFIPAHMQALHFLVAQKGGLEKIRLYGLAGTIAL
jgi:hypothetical protein